MEATYVQDGRNVDYTPAAAVTGGAVVQLADGRAGVPANDIAAGRLGAARVEGIYDLVTATGIVVTKGCEIWWDASANEAVLWPANDEDFYVGTAQEDVASTMLTVKVDLNARPRYIVDLHRDAFEHIPVLTAGTPLLHMVGGSCRAAFSATAEAQKLDLLSKRSFPVASNWILEAELVVAVNADADVADLNVGVANATHASDGDAITEAVFAHLDMGADLNIDAESDDGTTEVAATDTTVDFAVGTPVRIVLDGRDHTDVQVYVNGVNVLPDSVFTLAAAAGPLKALFHLEKSSNDSPGVVYLNNLTVRLAAD